MENEKLLPIIDTLKNILYFTDQFKSKVHSFTPNNVSELQFQEKLKEYSNTLLSDSFAIADLLSEYEAIDNG